MYKKGISCLLIGFIIVLLLAGCKAQQDSSKTENPSTAQKKGAILYIGIPGQLKEVSVQNAATAEELVSALGKETGWNLTLAQPPADGELPNTKVIAFATGSAIYSAPPDPQKESYHVFDSEDYILTVLNSVSETLCRNLDLDGVYFTSPDGGTLTLENGGYSFSLSNLYCWDYLTAKEANQAAPGK